MDEVQTVNLTGDPEGGTFTLTYSSEETDPIAFDATAAAVQAALEALPNIGVGDVVCTGDALPAGTVTCTFSGELSGLAVSEMTGDGALLTGGTTPDVAIATTTAGVQGSFRGATVGTWLQDSTNGLLYINNGTKGRPVWVMPRVT